MGIQSPISVCRTHRTSKYFSISNETAQDDEMSFEALGLLTHCLSKPPTWKFHFEQIWKARKVGRDKLYKIFDELIDRKHCIRIRLPNPKFPNLPGEIEYEFYDDLEESLKRIEELKKFADYSDRTWKLKKCFRHPEIQHAENQDDYKERSSLLSEICPNSEFKEKQQQKRAAVSSKKEQKKQQQKPRIHDCLRSVEIPDVDKYEISAKWEELQVKHAVEWATHPETKINKSLAAAIKWACVHNPQIPVSKVDRVKENKNYAMKYDKIKKRECEIMVGNTYVEISHAGSPHSFILEYTEEGFKEQFLNALRKRKFDFIE